MIILELLLTVFIYLVFPITYITVKGKVPHKKARTMAIINSVVCAIFFSIIQMVAFADDPSYVPNFLPAILYYFIGKSILTENRFINRKK